MNSSKTLLYLPPESLVPFGAKRLKKPYLLWNDEKVHEDELDVFSYAFAIPHVGDDPEYFSDEERIFYADRYGGRGVGGNGGSGRCGSKDRYQIKGIGRTPLAGSESEFWHNHGGMTLAAAVRETIWSQVYDAILPHGAVRTVAVFGTSTQTYAKSASDGKTARGLMLRELNVRPAHFMRAVNFSTSTNALCRPGVDTHRTIRAIAQLKHVWSKIHNLQRACDPEFLRICTKDMVRRFAQQIATARALRIPHGALNCSNICLDGRYVDFGSATALPDHQKYHLAPGNPDSWNDETTLVQTLRDFHFYLTKYLPHSEKTQVPEIDELLELYQDEFANAVVLQFARLSGVPIKALSQVKQSTLEDFCLSLFNIGFGDEPRAKELPSVFSHQVSDEGVVSVLMRSTAFLTSHEKIAEAARKLGISSVKAQKFAVALNELRNVYCLTQVATAVPFVRAQVALNTFRLSSACTDLVRPKLSNDIDNLLAEKIHEQTTADFIAKRIFTAVALLGEGADDMLPVDFLDQPFDKYPAGADGGVESAKRFSQEFAALFPNVSELNSASFAADLRSDF